MNTHSLLVQTCLRVNPSPRSNLCNSLRGPVCFCNRSGHHGMSGNLSPSMSTPTPSACFQDGLKQPAQYSRGMWNGSDRQRDLFDHVFAKMARLTCIPQLVIFIIIMDCWEVRSQECEVPYPVLAHLSLHGFNHLGCTPHACILTQNVAPELWVL